MSDFGKPQQCRNSCGMTIYFDKDSTVGHPSPERWIPLEFVNGIRTDNPHNCPNRRPEGKTTTTSTTTSTTATTTSQEDPNLEGQVIQLMKELMKELISKMELLIKQRA